MAGADVIQFEPSWYFFDEFFPCTVAQSPCPYDPSQLERPLASPSGPATHKERLTLRRLKAALAAVAATKAARAWEHPVHLALGNGTLASPDLGDTFDRNQAAAPGGLNTGPLALNLASAGRHGSC